MASLSQQQQQQVDMDMEDMQREEKAAMASSYQGPVGESRMRRLSVSPPRERSPMSYSQKRTPSPAHHATLSPAPGIPRTSSSPSLMDSSPKPPSSSSRTGSPHVGFAPTIPQSPSMTAGISRKANELTPVTNNMSAIKRGQYVEDGLFGVGVVSPDDNINNTDNEHLALPSHPDRFVEGSLQRRPSKTTGLSIPPLQQLSERAKSMGCIHDDDDEDMQQRHDYLDVPVKFPPDRKYLSFTSEKQFVDRTAAAASSSFHQSGMTPYQPPHREGTVVGIAQDDLEEIYRHPLDIQERQFSIPSIHLANHLNGSNTTSYTDEEDFLGQDDHSLSSRGSSLYLPGDEEQEEDNVAGLVRMVRLSVTNNTTATSSRTNTTTATARHGDIASDDGGNAEDANYGNDTARLRKNDKEKQAAYEWLHSLESNNISEAASSKFLTAGPPAAPMPDRQRRSFVRTTAAASPKNGNA